MKIKKRDDSKEKIEEVLDTEKTLNKNLEKDDEKKSKLKDFKKKLEESEKEKEEIKDSYQRLRAEFDNYKKRTQKEKDAIYVDSVADTIKTILPVIDNFERAISQDTDNIDSIKEGMNMIENVSLSIIIIKVRTYMFTRKNIDTIKEILHFSLYDVKNVY